MAGTRGATGGTAARERGEKGVSLYVHVVAIAVHGLNAHTLFTKKGPINSPGLLAAAGMKAPGLAHSAGMVASRDGVGGQASDTDAATNMAKLGRLDGESLAHDGTAVGKQLQLGHGAATRGGGGLWRWAGRSRQRAQSGR